MISGILRPNAGKVTAKGTGVWTLKNDQLAELVSRSHVMVAGIAGLVTGAMSMAAGEYLLVRSQTDSEQAASNLERAELSPALRNPYPIGLKVVSPS